jgi:uncharacterized protein
MDDRLGWCIGCRRTRAEIKAWSTASPSEKRAIVEKLAARAAAEPELLAAGGSQQSESVRRGSCESDSDSR